MKAPSSAATDYLQTMIHSADSATNKSFPCTLHRMLCEIDNQADREEGTNLHKIISWEAHGLGFKIHNRKKFSDAVMPIWFPRLKYSSWVRQLNTFGFKRVLTDGKDKSSVYHEQFLRDQPEMAASIKRVSKKSKNNQTKESDPASDASTASPMPMPSSGLVRAVSNTISDEPLKSLSAPAMNGLHNMLFQNNMIMANCSVPPTSLFSQVQDSLLGKDIFVMENTELNNDNEDIKMSSFTNDTLSNAFHDVWSTLESCDDGEPLPFDSLHNDDPLPLDEPLDETLFFDNIEPLRVFACDF